MPDKTLILGGGGFLGTAVARALARRNVPLRLFDRQYPAFARDIPGDVEYVLGDALDEQALESAVRGCNRVLCFLGFTVPSSSTLVRECDTTLRSLALLLSVMERQGADMLFYPSSGGTVYGDSPDRTPHAETDALNPEGTYALGKVLSEEMIRFHSRRSGMRHIIGRLANPYGNDNPAVRPQGVVDVSLARILRGGGIELWGDGQQVRDFIFADDLAEMVARLLECGTADITINIGSGQGVTVLEIMEAVGAVTGTEVSVVKNETAYAGVRHSVLDTSMLRELVGGLDMVPLEEGVRRTWERMRRNGSDGD
ncbi:NAD-dependent epimerase/dehydratase family protein [Salidesulfovibrio brasiliensis]